MSITILNSSATTGWDGLCRQMWRTHPGVLLSLSFKREANYESQPSTKEKSPLRFQCGFSILSLSAHRKSFSQSRLVGNRLQFVEVGVWKLMKTGPRLPGMREENWAAVGHRVSSRVAVVCQDLLKISFLTSSTLIKEVDLPLSNLFLSVYFIFNLTHQFYNYFMYVTSPLTCKNRIIVIIPFPGGIMSGLNEIL